MRRVTIQEMYPKIMPRMRPRVGPNVFIHLRRTISGARGGSPSLVQASLSAPALYGVQPLILGIIK